MQHNPNTTRAAQRFAAELQASCVGVRVGRLSRLVGRHYETALRPLGLSVAQLEVLGALAVIGEPARPTDLGTWLAVERSTMSRNLAAMERRGYVEPTDVSPTGRSQRVAITAAGEQALAQARTAWAAAQKQVVADLGDDAVPTLDGWLGSLTRQQT